MDLTERQAETVVRASREVETVLAHLMRVELIGRTTTPLLPPTADDPYETPVSFVKLTERGEGTIRWVVFNEDMSNILAHGIAIGDNAEFEAKVAVALSVAAQRM